MCRYERSVFWRITAASVTSVCKHQFTDNWRMRRCDQQRWTSLWTATNKLSLVFLFLPSFLSCHRNSSRAVSWQSAWPAQLLSHTQRWRLRYGEAVWGKERGDTRRDFRFLCDAFSPWGQGATVIQSHRAAVQKPPPINTLCVDCYKLPESLGKAGKSIIWRCLNDSTLWLE